MDPLTGAITGAVVFVILAFLLFAFIIFVFTMVGAAIADEGGALIGAILGWIAAIGWFVFAIVKAIAFIVQAVGLA